MFAYPTKGVWCVYLLKQVGVDLKETCNRGDRSTYVGMTNDVGKRVAEHNAHESSATKHATWELVGVAWFRSRKDAALVERWYKVGNSRGKRLQLAGYCRTGIPCSEAQSKNILLAAQIWQISRQLRATVTDAPETEEVGR